MLEINKARERLDESLFFSDRNLKKIELGYFPIMFIISLDFTAFF